MQMDKLKKPFKSIDDEILILQSRGLYISDLEDAKKKLLNNNYYTIINGYKYPFLQKGASCQREQYKEHLLMKSSPSMNSTASSAHCC